MKKSYLYGIGGLVIVAIIIAVVVGGGSGKKSNDSSSTGSSSSKSSSYSANVKDACNILTQSIADNLLGAGAKAGDSTAGNTETGSVKVTNCSYTSADNRSTLGLLVRAAKDQTQADADATPFTGKTNISGYGDKAYWDSSYGQFNILAHNNWYILSYGSLSPAQRTQADGQKFADAIKSQL